MSGIFGIVRPPDAPVAEAELAPMADALKHRGPDGVMVFGRDNIGLGHCMLHSTPESLHEKLPLRVGASGLTITADARIDNRKQLIADIPVNQANGQIITDSELILHAYSKWGKACVEKLLGDFVFAIWDENRQCLFVARDHMGCKPFYYHHNRVQLVFASSAVGVNAAHCVSTNINRGRVADYLVEFLEGIDKTSTFFTDIYRLPPGHTLSYQAGEITTHCYWQPTLGTPIRYSRDEDYLEAFEEIFQQAVSARLRTHCRPAAMLSGGIDSSVIAAIARTQLQTAGTENLQTYTAFDDSISDCKEAYHARLLVSRGGFDSHE
ncbi:MAG: asparagine synthetase B, partial [Proteobacteria bacterium]|nr:asparagine synthetase B [Pseudomonadota bacterium]